tara:strand:+ start:5150 stop:6283 length:1134 start_codon:yes stop_codon:yes gene_type:complete
MEEYLPSLNFIDLKKQQETIKCEIDNAINKVLDHGKYIMGPEVLEFEEDLKKFTKSKYAISCGNGTDAITIALMSLGIKKNDVVFVPSFSYIASAETIVQLGAIPFFIDVDKGTFNISLDSFKQAIIDVRKLSLKPSFLIPVELFGQPIDFENIADVAEENNIKIIVDSAQSFGAKYKDKRVGSYGHITTTSFFPAKPLGCYGDGGAIFTQNKILAQRISSIRLHGKGEHKYDHVDIGVNSRLDTIQAAILRVKIKIFEKELEARQKIAELYNSALSDYVETPTILKGMKSAWAQYTLKIKNRDHVRKKLNELNIPTMIYYPIHISEQQAYKGFPRVSSGLPNSKSLTNSSLSLPMHPYLTDREVQYIANEVIKLVS